MGSRAYSNRVPGPAVMGLFIFWLLCWIAAVALMAISIVALDRRNHTFFSMAAVSGSILTLMRVGCLWYLAYLSLTDQGSPDQILLLVFFMPEGLIGFAMGNVVGRSTQQSLELFLASLVLMAGSFLWASLTTVVIQRIRRYPN